jgi:hypothetical protein
VIVDRAWNLVSANGPALRILTDGVAPALLAPPVNALRVSLHPDGLAPRIANLAEYGAHLLQRLQRQIAASGDPVLAALHEELSAYPGVAPAAKADPKLGDVASMLFVPLVLDASVRGKDQLTFFSTLATFGTALDITVSELAIESFFPADESTERALRKET